MNIRALFFLLTLTITTCFISCGGDEPAETVKATILTAEDRRLCDSLQLDTALIVRIREQTQSQLYHFTPEPLWLESEDGGIIERPSALHGVYFEATQENAREYVFALSYEFQKAGYTIYVCEENFGIGGLKDKVAIVPTADMYTILKETGTDGINYDIDNDSMITIMKTFDAKYDLTLIGCHKSWCEFTFAKEPTNWQTLADECYAICPDVVDQGTGTVEELASELQRTKTLYFWWD